MIDNVKVVMNSDSVPTLHSKAPTQFASSHPLGGLPPEIWEKVLTHLENDPESLYNCYKTCVTWKRILEPDKTQFLFQLVAPILKLGHLPTSEFLKCRRICKKWCLGVEETFHNIPYLSRDFSVHCGIVPYTWYTETVGVEFNTYNDVQSFINDVYSTPKISRNPFFHKTVKCCSNTLDDNPETNRLFQEFTALMSEPQLRDSIESCIYIAYGGKPESDRKMENIFKNLPNLKSLAILKRAPGMPVYGEEDTSGFNWLLEKKDLLPPLPNLVSVNTYLTDAPLIAEMVLLSYGTEIESFHCDFKVIQHCAYFRGPVPEHGLHNLCDLDVFDAFGCSFFMERLLLFEMPFLKRLALEYVEVGPRKQSFMSILNIIDSFAGSLKEIRLPQKLFNWTDEVACSDESCRKLQVKMFEKSANIILPHVQRLGVNLEILKCPVKTWFFKKFPNLEILHVTNYGVTFGCELHLNQLKKELLPFWELIPSIREIIVERAYLKNFHFYRR